MGNCIDCGGLGFTAEHDPNDPHINGCTNCPIQAPCWCCNGTGWVRSKRELFIERIKTQEEIYFVFAEPDELPF